MLQPIPSPLPLPNVNLRPASPGKPHRSGIIVNRGVTREEMFLAYPATSLHITINAQIISSRWAKGINSERVLESPHRVGSTTWNSD